MRKATTHPRPLVLAGIATLLILVAATAHYWYGNRHDFFDLAVYREAMIWWREHPLYDFAKPDATQGTLGFTYPPFAALLLAPLAWLSWPAAVWTFVVLAAILYALVVWWFVRPLTRHRALPAWFVFTVAFVLSTALEPIREAFTFGQINFLLWTLVAFDLLVLQPRGSRLTGVGIGVATAIKLTPGIFIVYLVACRRWRAAAVAAGSAAAAAALAATVAPTATWAYLTRTLPHASGVGHLDYAFNVSLLGLLARLAAPDRPSMLLWALLVLAVLGYGLWRAALAAQAGDEVAGLALAGIVGSLISPITWLHHVVWFVPAIVVLVDRAWSRTPSWVGGRSSRAGAWALAVLAYLTTSYSFPSLWAYTLHQPNGLAGLALPNWPILVMLALLVLLPIRSAQLRHVDLAADGRLIDVADAQGETEGPAPGHG